LPILGGGFVATAVTLVEDEVHDREHRVETFPEQMVGRDPERDPLP